MGEYSRAEGLTGRKDLALNTAVGVPACTVGNDLVILVLYSVNNIKMNPTAVEVLCNMHAFPPWVVGVLTS